MIAGCLGKCVRKHCKDWPSVHVNRRDHAAGLPYNPRGARGGPPYNRDARVQKPHCQAVSSAKALCSALTVPAEASPYRWCCRSRRHCTAYSCKSTHRGGRRQHGAGAADAMLTAKWTPKACTSWRRKSSAACAARLGRSGSGTLTSVRWCAPAGWVLPRVSLRRPRRCAEGLRASDEGPCDQNLVRAMRYSALGGVIRHRRHTRVCVGRNGAGNRTSWAQA